MSVEEQETAARRDRPEKREPQEVVPGHAIVMDCDGRSNVVAWHSCRGW